MQLALFYYTRREMSFVLFMIWSMAIILGEVVLQGEQIGSTIDLGK